MNFVRINSVSNTKKNSITYRIVWTGYTQINNICRYLYNNATVYLDRKRIKFTDIPALVKGASKYCGVRRHSNKWSANVGVNNKNIFVGSYHTELEAANARESYIVDNNIEDQVLNFGGMK